MRGREGGREGEEGGREGECLHSFHCYQVLRLQYNSNGPNGFE